MSDGTKRPDERPQSPSSQPVLVFKPDERQIARVARVRRYTTVVAVILMLVTLLLMIFYRPSIVARPGPATPSSEVRSVESLAPSTPPLASQPVVAQHKTSYVDVARSAAASIDTLTGQAADKWLRASELLPQGELTRDTEDAAAKLQKAVILADSARREIALAHGQAEVVLQVSHEAEPGVAFRLGVLYSAIDRYLKSMRDDAEDRYQYYFKSEASVQAVLGGNQDEAEIQQNVANGYLRDSEERQSSIRRLAQQMGEALRNIENADR